MTAAYVYIRFSSVKQEKGDSKERQLAACLSHCERRGWELAEEPFGDFGVSAWKGDHLKSGKLGLFADRVRAGEIPAGSVLVVEALDRLSRQEWRVARNWLEEMTDIGLRIATVQGDRLYDKASMSGQSGLFEMMEIMMKGHANNWYVEQLSIRLKSSWEKRRKKAGEGKIISAHVPGWLKVMDDETHRYIIQIADRVETVRLIYELSAEGLGARTIARTLNERGIQTFGREHHHAQSKAVGWEHTYVSDILKSSAVEGDYEPGIGRNRNSIKTGERFVGYFGKPIVDADLVARARLQVSKRKGTGGRGKDQQYNLFSGLVTCAHCQGKMAFVRSSKGKAFFQCADASRGRGCPERRMFGYMAFEKAALDALLPLALDDTAFHRPADHRQLAIEAAQAAKAVEVKQAEASRLVAILSRIESPTTEAHLADVEVELRGLIAKRDAREEARRTAIATLTPQEHLKRVLEVRDALGDADYETRIAARRKVALALRELGVLAVCRVRDGERVIQLGVPNGIFHCDIDNAGTTTVIWDGAGMFEWGFRRATPENRRLMVEGIDRRNPEQIARFRDIMKRRGLDVAATGRRAFSLVPVVR